VSAWRAQVLSLRSRILFPMSKSTVRTGIIVVVLAALGTACGNSASSSSTNAPITIPPTNFQTVPTTPPTTTTIAAPVLGPDGQPAPGSKTTDVTNYTILASDVPIRVAKKFGITVEALDAANTATTNYKSFYAGLVIKIPAGATIPSADPAAGSSTTLLSTESSTATATSLPTSSTVVTAGATTTSAAVAAGAACGTGSYTVAAGDVPIKVAKNFDITVAQLDAANASTKGYKSFYVGLKIVIPKFKC